MIPVTSFDLTRWLGYGRLSASKLRLWDGLLDIVADPIEQVTLDFNLQKDNRLLSITSNGQLRLTNVTFGPTNMSLVSDGTAVIPHTLTVKNDILQLNQIIQLNGNHLNLLIPLIDCFRNCYCQFEYKESVECVIVQCYFQVVCLT